MSRKAWEIGETAVYTVAEMGHYVTQAKEAAEKRGRLAALREALEAPRFRFYVDGMEQHKRGEYVLVEDIRRLLEKEGV
jgi:hypothetical protein